MLPECLIGIRLSMFLSCGTLGDIYKLCSNLLGLISFFVFNLFSGLGMFISGQARKPFSSPFLHFFPWVVGGHECFFFLEAF